MTVSLGLAVTGLVTCQLRPGRVRRKGKTQVFRISSEMTEVNRVLFSPERHPSDS